jgi:hypothetical protein
MIKTKGHTIQWSRQKDIQYNDQDKRTYNTMIKTKGHTIQWSRQKNIQYNGQDKRTYNTMVKKKGHTIQWSRKKESLYCMSFCLDHCIVCPFVLTIVLYVLLSWPLYCMSFCLDHCIVCHFVLTIALYIQYNGQDKRTYNTMVKTKGTKRQAMIGKTLHRKTWTPNRRWHQVNLVTNAVICHEWEIDQIVITAYRTWSLTWSYSCTSYSKGE